MDIFGLLSKIDMLFSFLNRNIYYTSNIWKIKSIFKQDVLKNIKDIKKYLKLTHMTQPWFLAFPGPYLVHGGFSILTIY